MKLRRYLSLWFLMALAAQPPAPADGDTPLRAAQDAWRRGDDGTAGKLYEAAGERSQDPGLIAFNLGAIRFRQGEFREAEIEFRRALDDRDAPAERRARAHYNRGVCLLRLGGLARFRTAIECFERGLGAADGEPSLSADAEHNLELAKLLWLEARAKSAAKPRPNETPPDETPQEPSRPDKPGASDGNPPDERGTDPTATPRPGDIDPVSGKPRPGQATATKKTVGGRGNLPVTADWAGWQPQNEAEAHDYLKGLAARLSRDRRELLDLTAPPEQPHVKDW